MCYIYSTNIKTNIKTNLNSATIAVDAISKIKDSANVGTDGLFATDALISYKQQLEGLTVTQQKMALIGTNLSEAQRKQVLQFIAATAATKTLTAEQVLSCTADEKQILVKAGLIAEEQLEKGSTIELTEEKLKEILANEALSVSDKNIILNKFGVTGANLTEASSWIVLGKSIAKATLEKLKWLATTHEGWITLAVAAIVGAIAAYVKWGATLENTREKLEDLKSECDTITSEIESVNGELETTKQRLEELAGKPSLTFTEKEEYDNLVKQNNELQRQLALQKMLLDEKNKEKNKTFVSAMEKDVEVDTEYHESPTDIDENGEIVGKTRIIPGLVYDEYDERATEKQYIEQQIDDYQDNLDKIADLDEQYKDDLNNKKYLKERARIEEENEKISKYLQEKNTEFTTASDDIDYIEEPKNEDEEKVNKWLDFINDFQDKMAIAMGGDNAKANAFNRVVNNWQFDDVTQGLQDLGKEGKVTAEMLDDPKYDEFIKKLVELGIIDSADNLDAVALAFNNVTNSGKAAAAAEKATASLSELSKSLDNIQSAYKSVQSAIQEYNEQGYLSVDTYQALMELEPQYLNMLIDENGNLNLNSDAVQKNTAAYIENMGIKAAQNLIDKVSNLSGEAAQLEYLTGVTEENTAATWENIAAQLVSAEAVSSPEVMTALKQRINAIYQMTEATKEENIFLCFCMINTQTYISTKQQKSSKVLTFIECVI